MIRVISPEQNKRTQSDLPCDPLCPLCLKVLCFKVLLSPPALHLQRIRRRGLRSRKSRGQDSER